MRFVCIIRVAVAVLLAPIACRVSLAETWTASSPGDFLTASNWGGSVPNGVGATAIISTQPTNAGDFTLNGSMTLTNLFYSNSQARSINGTGILTLNIVSGAPEIAVTGGPLTINTKVSGPQGLKKTGDGMLILTNNTNNYTGGTTISAGTLSGNTIANRGVASAFGASTSGADFTISNGATLQYTGGNASTNCIVALGSGGGGIDVSNSGTTLTWDGTVSGASGLTKSGAGTLVLTSSNTYSGPTAVSSGYLQGSTIADSGLSSSFGSGSTFNLSNGGMLYYAGGSASTNRDISLGSGGGGVAFATPAEPQITLIVSGLVSGTGGLIVGNGLNGGKLSLTNAANSYTGINTINPGYTLSGNTIANRGTNSAFGQGDFAIPSFLGTLEYTGGSNSTNRNLTFGTDATISVTASGTDLAFNGSVNGEGSLTKTGAGKLTLTATNDYDDTYISGGTLSGTSIANAGSQSSFGTGDKFEISNGATLEYAGPSASSNRWIRLKGSGTISVAGSSTLTLTRFIGSGAIQGTGDFTKDGSGILQLNGINTYIGRTTIKNGMLKLGTNERIPNLSAVTIESGGTLNLNNFNETFAALAGSGSISLGSGNLILSDGNPILGSVGTSMTFSGAITGTGSVTKIRLGAIELTGSSSYSGGTTITNGKVLASNISGSATGSGPVIVDSGGGLGGAGTVGGSVTINSGGVLAPGTSVGTFKVNNNLVFTGGAILDYEVNGNTSSADLVNVAGNLTINSTAKLNYTNLSSTPVAGGTKITVASYAGSWDGSTFAGHANGGISYFQGQGFVVNYDDSTGAGDYGHHVTLTATNNIGALQVVGSPAYDSTTGEGYKDSSAYSVNDSGTAGGAATKYVSGKSVGYRALRWEGTAANPAELGTLGTSAAGYTEAYAANINESGTAVGQSKKYVSSTDVGYRAVRWNASGTSATELDNLGTDATGYTYASASAVNTAGTAVGSSDKYVSGINVGRRAVRWDASSTTATELGNLGTYASGSTGFFNFASAVAVNSSGTAVGYSPKIVSDNYLGPRAVRWDASGTTATELGNLGTDANGYTYATAVAVNDAGTTVGYATKFVSGVDLGDRAVRWNASGTSATELGNLGTAANGSTSARAVAVNEAGTAVGSSGKYISGISKGSRAVRWHASNATAIELGNLGTDVNGSTWAYVEALNNAGTAVGAADKYVSGSYIGRRATIWLPDATAVDINDLLPADSSWELTRAEAVSDDGWVTAHGTFTPTIGSAYTRAWLAQIGLGGTWTSAFSGSLNGAWGRGPQWSTGTPAMYVGDATFSANSACTVSLDRNENTRTINFTAGDVTLNLNGYSLTSQLGTTIASGATLKVSSTGTATIAGDVANSGTLAPGTSAGTLHIAGNYNQPASGKLQIELASLSSFDKLQVDSSIALSGGTLEVLLLGGYTPTAGTQFDILDFGSLTGTFSTLTLPALGPLLSWNTTALYTSGTLSVTSAGSGSAMPSTEPFSSVPEPATILPLLFAMAGLCLRTCRAYRTLK